MGCKKIILGGILVVLSLSAQAAWAKTVKVNAGEAYYQNYPAIRGITNSDEHYDRVNAAWGIYGRYTTKNGLGSLDVLDRITITWIDGSEETFVLNCKSSAICPEPVPGTQKAPQSQGGGEPVAGGGGRPGGGAPGGGSGSGTVTVGPIKKPYEEQAN